MIKSNRTYWRIVVAICVVVLGLFVLTVAPLASPSSNSTPRLNPLTYTPGDNESGEGNILDAADPITWLANTSPTQRGFNICLQDDTSRDTLQINSVTGVYKYTRCSDGRLLTGTGTVTTNGCILTLQHFIGTRRVSASVDTCLHSGRATIQVGATVGDLNVIITDSNTVGNTCDCTPPPPPPRVNISVGSPTFFFNCESVIVFVPIEISRVGSVATVMAGYSLSVVNGQGEEIILEVGTIASTIVPTGRDNCTLGQDPESGCSGSCANRQEFIARGCLFGEPGCVPQLIPIGGPIPAQCQTQIFGGGCGCNELPRLEFGPFPRNRFGPNSSLVFRIDPNGQVPEFNENDNDIIVPIPPSCAPGS